MPLTKTQKGVAAGMAGALAASVVVLGIAGWLLPFKAGQPGLAIRLSFFAVSALAPAITLALSIARLAKHRFFSEQDIEGSALTHGTDRARLLQALLQNTLEQAALAIPAYFAWSVVASPALLSVLPAAAMLFLIGRVLFFIGYSGGAVSRAFGFALTFYPSLALLIGVSLFSLWRAFG